ncbi:hypothetical protein FRC09_000587 [Ceratobasidium sp. 395]|nr:hypothetical protein FRC09_000587 [Ceratobasidium sp. 395]
MPRELHNVELTHIKTRFNTDCRTSGGIASPDYRSSDANADVDSVRPGSTEDSTDRSPRRIQRIYYRTCYIAVAVVPCAEKPCASGVATCGVAVETSESGYAWEIGGIGRGGVEQTLRLVETGQETPWLGQLKVRRLGYSASGFPHATVDKVSTASQTANVLAEMCLEQDTRTLGRPSFAKCIVGTGPNRTYLLPTTGRRNRIARIRHLQSLHARA